MHDLELVSRPRWTRRRIFFAGAGPPLGRYLELDSVFFTLLSKFSYIGLFSVLIAAGLGVPLPEDIPLLAAGWLVFRGKADLALMMLTGLGLVAIGLVAMLATDRPEAIAVGVIGLAAPRGGPLEQGAALLGNRLQEFTEEGSVHRHEGARRV